MTVCGSPAPSCISRIGPSHAHTAVRHTTQVIVCTHTSSVTIHSISPCTAHPYLPPWQALQQLASSLALRLLAAASECHLHSRLPGCGARAKDAATEALRWALQHELSPALAHRQLGRVHWALGDLGNADLALSQVGGGRLDCGLRLLCCQARLGELWTYVCG